uniref:Chaperone protein DnaJ-like isoform X1 n=1 Tax=Cymbidium ensifolium TaxID=78740 RepID=A0A5B9MTK8_CYMEN|nr:chaperone protein DnaJ-like isoform X1 [Cymbidium ensifolium]QEG03097.1 chaperone protein DnaJ-like isoform X2 [Cymbidium ensifolium]
MTAFCLCGGGFTSGTFPGHVLNHPSNHTSLQCSLLFVYSPARPRPKCYSISSSFLLGEFNFCKNPSSQLLRPGWRCNWRKSGVFKARAKDFYEALNLNRDATIKEIKSSYRNLARKYHPDMNKSPGAEEKFKEISAAYEVLSDEEKRSFYDQYGEAGPQGDYAGANAGPHGVDPFEVFNAFFGQSNGFFGDEEDPMGINFNSRFKQSVGLDIRYDLSLSLEESISGGQREINIPCYETCDSCNGSGAKSSKSIKTCSECDGRGRMMKTQRTPFGVVSQVSSCPNCGGSGKIVIDHCKMCNGEGKLQIKQSVKIDVPAGVSDGSTILFKGEGSSDKKKGYCWRSLSFHSRQ